VRSSPLLKNLATTLLASGRNFKFLRVTGTLIGFWENSKVDYINNIDSVIIAYYHFLKIIPNVGHSEVSKFVQKLDKV
jgi:hypothetical protein